MSGPSIADIVHNHAGSIPYVVQAALIEELQAREDAIADVLRLAGQQFGMYPQIVAEVIASAELGTTPPEAERAMIRAQFSALMESIARAQRGEGPMPTP